MTSIPVNGINLNVEEAGEGFPLVLLHGFTGSTSTWAPFFEEFGRARRIIAVDLLGHGHSDSPPDPDRYRMEHTLEDLTALLGALRVEEYDLLGYSMGGRVALHLALAHGSRIRKLILESTSPGIQGQSERARRVEGDQRLAALLEQEGIEAFVDHWENLPLFASQTRLPASVRETLRRQRLAGNPIGFAGSLRGIGAGVPRPLFRQLPELPTTLLIAGELDQKYCRLAQLMERAIPDSTVVIVPDAGHTVHLEQPHIFQDTVLHFLTSQQPVPPPPPVGQGFSPVNRHGAPSSPRSIPGPPAEDGTGVVAGKGPSAVDRPEGLRYGDIRGESFTTTHREGDH